MHIVDFGAGSGAYAFAIAKRLANSGYVYAIDVQKDLLRRIHNEAEQKGYKNVRIIWADLEKPKASKIADREIDVVLISNVLFQIEHKKAVLEEAHRILKKTGRLAIIDWADSFGMMGPHKDHVLTKEGAHHLLAQTGFQVGSEFHAGAHHWGILARPAHMIQ